MTELTLTISGDVGSGKSALIGEIEILLRALKIPFRHEKPEDAAYERRMANGDWITELERLQPSVVLVEAGPPTAAQRLEYLEGFEIAAGMCDLGVERMTADLGVIEDAEAKLILKGAIMHGRNLAAAFRLIYVSNAQGGVAKALEPK